jgi:hypothetical protein
MEGKQEITTTISGSSLNSDKGLGKSESQNSSTYSSSIPRSTSIPDDLRRSSSADVAKKKGTKDSESGDPEKSNLISQALT